jgi:CTP:molybdopterin cytidylyltransferase MocA
LDEAGYAPIVVVLGHAPDAIRDAIPSDVDVSVVVNERYQDGRSSSIVAGVGAVAAARADAVLIGSVDQPRSVGMLRTLREGWERERPLIAVPSLDHRVGHPPVFGAGVIDELLAVTEEREGLREVMQAHGDQRLFVDVDDPLALTNLNTREDYEAALGVAQA